MFSTTLGLNKFVCKHEGTDGAKCNLAANVSKINTNVLEKRQENPSIEMDDRQLQLGILCVGTVFMTELLTVSKNYERQCINSERKAAVSQTDLRR